MCGIFGIASLNDHSPNPEFLHQAARLLHHRGPDAEGLFVGSRVCLGMRRLSIMDVSNGRQPLYSRDRQVTVVFNGEIYNYRELRSELEKRGFEFRTETDGEVLPYLYETYGLDFVQKLNGIFAIALWDEREQRLVLVRDHLGIKPLFYTHSENGDFLFASEMKALLAWPGVERTLDRELLPEYLLFRYTAGTRTLYKGISALLPGHTLVLKNRQIRIHRYWSPNVPAGEQIDDAQALDSFKTLMNDAVQRQIVSDVPLGALLSGGLDSSYICALAVKHRAGRGLDTFSIGYDGEGFNELPQARSVAQFLGTRSHELLITNRDFAQALERVTEGLELPIYQPNAIPLYLICRYAKPFVSVLLSGEGADELFAGYPRYRAVPLFHAAKKMPARMQQWGRQVLQWAGHRRSIKLAEALALSPEEVILQNAAFIRADITGQLLNKELRWEFAFRQSLQAQDSEHPGPQLNDLLVFEQKTYLVSLLERLDRMSMASSIEARVPFLDYRVVELVNRISQNWKLRGGNSKILLKRAAEGLIPEAILKRKKWGFVAPLGGWMRDARGLGAYLDLLEEPAFRQEAFFDAMTVSRLIREHRAGIQDHSEVLWELLSFALWHKLTFQTPVRAEAVCS